MEAKQNLFGFEGSITPPSLIKDLNEEWEQDGIGFSVKNSVFKVIYSNRSDKEKALHMAELFIQWWKFENNIRLEVSFNHFWGPKEEHIDHSLVFNENINMMDKMATVHTKTLTMVYNIMARARIVGRSDSFSFIDNRELVAKSLHNTSLKKALEFYSEEVVDERRPYYGIYKAIEELSSTLGGRQNLVLLAGKSKTYIDDLMQTANSERHARSNSKKVLSESQCKERAKILIESYAKSLK